MIEYTVIVYGNGNKYWYLNGQLHREDGPAIEYTCGTKSWYLDGKLHREDGPAKEFSCGAKKWYLNGKQVTEEEHKKLTSKATCAGKVVEIDGIKYELKEV